MQEAATPSQPRTLAPAIRFGLAAAVAFVLAAVLAVATSASHTAVRNLSAPLQDATRRVTPAVTNTQSPPSSRARWTTF